MEDRELTGRERAVLGALLAVDFDGVEGLRGQAAGVVVVDECGCGCPSADFQREYGRGMTVRVNAGVRDAPGSLFLYTVDLPGRGEVLGGMEWAGAEDTGPAELLDPGQLRVEPA